VFCFVVNQSHRLHWLHILNLSYCACAFHWVLFKRLNLCSVQHYNCYKTEVITEKLSAFYGTRKFSVIVPVAYHWFLSWSRWIQSVFFHLSTLMSIKILSCRICLSLTTGLSNCTACIKTVYAVVLLWCTFQLYSTLRNNLQPGITCTHRCVHFC